jgi:hypothetical protein
VFIGLLCLGPGQSPSAAPTTKSSKKDPEELRRPLELQGFVLHVTREGTVTEIITAQRAYLYERLNVAYLRRVHVDFFKDATRKEKDVLDAPEGYLYLKDLVLDEEYPFYDRIGGDDAITTPTFFSGGKVKKVPRGRQDIDLIGRLGRKIIYRRVDGTEVESMRAYRDASGGKLYGVRQCKMRRLRPKTNDLLVIAGGAFTLDERLTSGIRVLDRGEEAMRISVEPMNAPADKGRP